MMRRARVMTMQKRMKMRRKSKMMSKRKKKTRTAVTSNVILIAPSDCMTSLSN